MIDCIPEPLLNISFLKLDDLSDSVQFLKDTGYSHFCTKRSAGSRVLEPAGKEKILSWNIEFQESFSKSAHFKMELNPHQTS